MIAILPYASDGSEASWRISSTKAMELKKVGAFDWGEFRENKTTLKYLKPGELQKVCSGEYKVISRKDNGAMILSSDDYQAKWIPGTQWHVSTHQAGGQGGSMLVKNILSTKRFDFPKSLYAVRDALKFICADKPDALIVDFFAGSGTTLHAVNLLNAEDGGHRRCILVTNNEVSADEAKSLTAKGYRPGDEEWEKLGIARYVTWPRTVCSIEGHDVNGNPLKGNYHGNGIPMADGFKTNVVFFRLGFLDKTRVSLGMQFRELLPTLWMKAGAFGKCPVTSDDTVPDMLIFPENRMAILNDENRFGEFCEKLAEHPQIEVVFLVTGYEASFAAMTAAFEGKWTYQLYRDYLDNFRINAERNAR